MTRISLLALAILVMAGCTTVDSYEAATARNVISGHVHDEIYSQGLKWALLTSWTKWDLREQQHPRGDGSDILDVLTADQLRMDVDASYRWRVERESVLDLFLEVGGPRQVEDLVYNTFRAAVRDAVAEVTATNLLSEDRAGLAPRIRALMERELHPRGVVLTAFFLRGIEPPERIRRAVEEKLSEEQRVEAEAFRTQVIREQANQRREEAAGIRDAQNIIAESLVGERGRAYLAYEGLQALKEAAQGQNNLIISPSEGGIPLMRPVE